MTETPTAVLSVDLEYFRHTPAVRSAAGTLGEQDVGEAGVTFLSDAFDRRGIETTWFVVADIVESAPGPVSELAAAGHEIGSHTRHHHLLSDLDDEPRQSEIERSKSLLEDATGTTVRGFRAPAFDRGPAHFDALAAAGYEYDSSVVPSRAIPGWYGGENDRQRPGPATVIQPGGPETVAELPVSVMPGLRLPLTGTWLRFFGPQYTILGMRLLARRGITPVLYVHPWELVDLPAVEGVPKRVFYHTGEWMQRAVERILEADFEFVTAREALADSLAAASPTPQ
jgi:hypothetical protein